MDLDSFIGKKIANFKILQIIGEGAYSTVCIAEETIQLIKNCKDNNKKELNSRKIKYKHISNNNKPVSKRYVACKIIPKINLGDKKKSKRLEQEIQIHKLMHHPNVVQFIDFQEDSLYYYVFLEYVAGCELFQLLLKNIKFSEQKSAVLFKQILLGLQYIHSLNVAHRDLKPQNILIDKFDRIKICDFGLSRHFDKKEGFLTKTPCGSPCYVSPECISGCSYNAEKSDLWSCGVILYIMVTGISPWTERSKPKLFEQIREGDFQLPSDVSENCSDLISRLMEMDPNKRITIEEALNHPFLKDVSVPESKIEFEFETPEEKNSNYLKDELENGIKSRKKVETDDENKRKEHIISFLHGFNNDLIMDD